MLSYTDVPCSDVTGDVFIVVGDNFDDDFLALLADDEACLSTLPATSLAAAADAALRFLGRYL